MNITDTYRLAYELMELHGLLDWRFGIDTRAKRRCGQCDGNTRTISLTEYFVLHNSDEEIRDCLLHEIAHALVGCGHGHDAVWKRMAAKIGAKPERLRYGAKMPERKWHAVCSKCGTVCLKRHKRSAKWRAGAYHTPCGSDTVLVWKDVSVS